MTLARRSRSALPEKLQAGIITALVAKGERAERLAVYLDDRFAFDLECSIVARAGLRRGEVLSEEEQVLLIGRDAPHRARYLAMKMLARRDLCCREVVARLERSGFTEGLAAQTVSRLEQDGYLDDARFARAFALERLKRGWGSRRIAAELVKKGVKRELVTGEGWQELVRGEDAVDETEAVLAVARRRFGTQLLSDPEGAKRRVSGFLARRGHDWEVIARVTRVLQAEAGRSADESLDE
jgi:regulatory protein